MSPRPALPARKGPEPDYIGVPPDELLGENPEEAKKPVQTTPKRRTRKKAGDDE